LDTFWLRIVGFHPKQDSDIIFKNRIGSDSKKHYPIISDGKTTPDYGKNGRRSFRVPPEKRSRMWLVENEDDASRREF